MRHPSEMTSAKKVTNAFVLEIIREFSSEKILYLNLSNFGVFQDISQHCSVEINKIYDKPAENNFDLIVADLPLGMNNLSTWESADKKIKVQTQINWIEILKSVTYLNNEGFGLFLVEPHSLRTLRGQKFRQELSGLGFQTKAIFNTPEQILVPETTIRPTILLISKGATEKIFIAELLNVEQVKEVVRNFSIGLNTHNLLGGITINDSEFKSFYHFKISRQISSLETQYKEYGSYQLSDVAVEINSVRSGEKFEERENAIYVPKLGKSEVVSSLDDARLKHHNYYQVILDDTLVKNDYAALFFSSTLGRLIIESLSSLTFIPHVNKADIESASIAIPELDEQSLLIGTHQKLSELKSAIEQFEKELALNPTSSLMIRDQIEITLDSLGKLTASDRVRGMIREGESKTIEFKQTLSLDIRTQKKEKHIELASLKTVAAFLNSAGGVLLISVVDNGEIFGLAEEIKKFHKKNKDNFLLHFKNLLKNRVGEEFYPLIEYNLVDVDEKPVLLVECKRSQKPCFLDQKDFYVRTNPATDKLEGLKQHEYIKQHFEG